MCTPAPVDHLIAAPVVTCAPALALCRDVRPMAGTVVPEERPSTGCPGWRTARDTPYGPNRSPCPYRSLLAPRDQPHRSCRKHRPLKVTTRFRALLSPPSAPTPQSPLPSPYPHFLTQSPPPPPLVVPVLQALEGWLRPLPRCHQPLMSPRGRSPRHWRATPSQSEPAFALSVMHSQPDEPNRPPKAGAYTSRLLALRSQAW